MLHAYIERVETQIVDLPLRRVQRFSRLEANRQSSLIVRVMTKEGIEGIGESITPCGPWWGGDSVESIKTTIDTYLAPLLLGRDAIASSAIMEDLDACVPANSFAKAGIEMSLLDCAGKVLNLPVHALLGGQLRDAMDVSWPLATGEAQADIEEAERMLAQRHARAFKIKMGFLPVDADLQRSVAIGRALEGRAKVRVDPNEAWDESTAARMLRPLEDAGIDVIEQPVARWNYGAMARLTQIARCAIMVDEGVRSNHDMMEVATRRAAGLVSLKIMKTGGLRATRAMAEIANAAGIPVYMGTFLETSIGAAANMQLAATLPELPYGGEVTGPMLMAEDICIEPARYENYALQLPSGPGLGIALDEDRIKHYRREGSRFVCSARAATAPAEAVSGAQN